MNGGTVRFAEVQYSRQWWIWLIVVGICALTIGVFGYGAVVQLALGRPWGDRPMSDTALIVTFVLVLLFDVGLVALFVTAHLRTEVRPDGLYIRYFPFHLSFRRLPLADVTEIEAVTYSPLADYGGWGIRHGLGLRGRTKGRAYNPTGNRGVRITYDNERHILLGSQRPEELAAAIRSLRESGAGE